jgi:hypothetical protein
MSLPRRIVYDASALCNPQLFDDSPQESLLFDVDMSNILGSFQQLVYVTAMVAETFDHLAALAEDVNERLKSATARVKSLSNKLPAFESRVFSIEVNENGHSGFAAKQKFLAHREIYIPTVIARSSNSPQIMAQYDTIQRLPAFWKLVPVTQQDTTKFYSDPGNFDLMRATLALPSNSHST